MVTWLALAVVPILFVGTQLLAWRLRLFDRKRAECWHPGGYLRREPATRDTWPETVPKQAKQSEWPSSSTITSFVALVMWTVAFVLDAVTTAFEMPTQVHLCLLVVVGSSLAHKMLRVVDEAPKRD